MAKGDYNNPVDYTGRPRNKATFEDQKAQEAAMKRWQDAKAQPISDRKAGSEPSNKSDHHTGDDDED